MSVSTRRLLAGILILSISPCVLAATDPAKQYQSKAADRVRGAVAAQQDGLAARLFGQSLEAFTLADVRRMAQSQAPQVLANAQQRRIAASGVERQRAAYDWSLAFTARYTQTQFNERSEDITRERVTEVTIGGNNVVDNAQEGQTDENGAPIAVTGSGGDLLCITVDGEVVNEEECALRTEVTTQNEFASADADATNAFSLGVTASKLFVPGGVLSGGLSLQHRTKNFYPLDDAGLIEPLSVDDPIGNGSRYPWTSRLFLQYLTPVPFGRGYGRDGSDAGLGLALAQVNDQRSRHSEHAVQQLLFLRIENAYWNHVRALLNVHAAESHRENLSARLASAERKFRARDLTRYELSQVESALAGARAASENAWVGFIATSAQLSALLGLEDGAMVLPAGFDETVDGISAQDQATALAQVMTDNPSINASRVAIRGDEAVLRHAEHSLKPDLNVVLSMAFSQSDRVLGYEDMADSLSHVFDPDNSEWFVGVQYRLALGKQAEKARKQQAELRLRQSQNALTLEEMQLQTELNGLIARNNAAIARTAHAERQLTLADAAFERGTRARGNGSISEFEYLLIVSDLDTAHQRWIEQLVEQQQVRAALLALQGQLTEQPGARP